MKSKLNIAIILLVLFLLFSDTIYNFLVFPLLDGFFIGIYGIINMLAFFTLLILLGVKLFQNPKPEIGQENISQNYKIPIFVPIVFIVSPIVLVIFLTMLGDVGFEFFLYPIFFIILIFVLVGLFSKLKQSRSSIKTIFSVLAFVLVSIFTLRISFPIWGDGSTYNWILEMIDNFVHTKNISFNKDLFYDVHVHIFRLYALISVIWFFVGIGIIISKIKTHSDLGKNTLVSIFLIPILIIILNILTIVFVIKPRLEDKPIEQQAFESIPNNCLPSNLNVNGTNNYLWPEDCYNNPSVQGYIKEYAEIGSNNFISDGEGGMIPVGVDNFIEKSVKLSVNGKENPDPIKYNSIFTLDFDFEGVTNCYAKDGPVPLYEERERYAHEPEAIWKDNSYVYITNTIPKVTSTKLIARDSNVGYVPNIKLTLECDDEKISDSIIIPLYK